MIYFTILTGHKEHVVCTLIGNGYSHNDTFTPIFNQHAFTQNPKNKTFIMQ